MTGVSTSPPATSCQPVAASTGSERPQRLVSMTPVAMHVVPARPAATPQPSRVAPARSTSGATPADDDVGWHDRSLDRLERRGLIARLPNPVDRRGTLVQLTDEGREAIEAAVDLEVDVEWRLVEVLSDREREQLTRLLRKLLLTADPESP